MEEMDKDWLSDAQEMWDASTQLYDLWENRWAKNERLVNSKHLTARKAGQSNLFVPKIETFHQSKMADHAFAFGGDDPVSLKRTMTSSKEGAKIMESVVNYYLTDAGGIDWTAFCINSACNALTYNFAPFVIDWSRGVTEVESEVEVYDEDGNSILETISVETETHSYPTLEVIPPEDFRVDPSVAWNELNMARYACVRQYRDERYAEEMEAKGLWPEIEDSEYNYGWTDDSNGLKNERAFQNSPFMDSDQANIDNGLLEVRKYWFYADLGNGYVPVEMETLADRMILSEPTEIEIDFSNSDGSDPFPFGVGRIYVKANEPVSRAMPDKLESLQIEENAIRNSRRDNVDLTLNPEKLVTPESGVDPAVFSRTVAGKVTVVRNINAVKWERPPEVTSSAYQEESIATNDMERLVAESAQKQGAATQRAESATAAKLMAAGASKATGFDSTIFGITCTTPAVRKLIKAIRQAAPIEIFEMAAEYSKVVVEDAYSEALRGDFRVTVGNGALQSSIDMAISNASNTAAITQSVYGAEANYFPIMSPIYEAQGMNPEDIIPNPMEQQMQPHPSQMDMGGVAGADNLSVQPNVQLSGGAFKGGGENNASKAGAA